ncbi:hypothetical protein Tco_0915609 [Tanacetum coccineum]
MMEADYELAQRLQAEKQGELTIEERSKLFVELMDKRNKHFAKLRAEEIKRKPPTKAQKRNQMSTYLRNMAGYKHTQLKNKSFEEIQMLFDKEMKRVNSFVPMDSEVWKAVERKLKALERKHVYSKRIDGSCHMLIMFYKILIVDGRHTSENFFLAEDKMYYQIIKVDGSEKYYKIFSAMLDDFDRQDVLDLYRLRLFDSCGIHLLLTDTGITIHMLVERKYPLTQEMLSRMLSRRLEVDHECEMAYELLRFTRSQLKK